jgi:hypothetical protein
MRQCTKRPSITKYAHKRRGMVDLLLVVSVIAIFAALLIPAFQSIPKSTDPSITSDSNLSHPKSLVVTNEIDRAATMKASFPFLGEVSFVVFLLGAGFATLAWSYKQARAQLSTHWEMVLQEVLSDRVKRSRGQISAEAKRMSFSMRWNPGAVSETIASLLSRQLLVVKDGCYTVK